MLYIHQSYCISPQTDFTAGDINMLNEPVDKKSFAIEPAYDGIPPGILRRMGKAIRMGVGAALPLIKQTDPVNGIIIGSANGGMEDCIKFLNQIVQYDEGLLAPGNFVQSTSNVIAGQLGMISGNKGYNITHVHLGHAFENAMTDAIMQLNENPSCSYLLGGVDEISGFNYNIEDLAGAYKKEDISIRNLYESGSPGCIAGEGAAMFIVNKKKEAAIAQVITVNTLHSKDEAQVKQQLENFLQKNLAEGTLIDLFLSGENGDTRVLPFYKACESLLADEIPVARFKHISGEYPTAVAMGLWYACEILKTQHVPQHLFKREISKTKWRNILMYNNFKGYQHSFMLISIP